MHDWPNGFGQSYGVPRTMLATSKSQGGRRRIRPIDLGQVAVVAGIDGRGGLVVRFGRRGGRVVVGRGLRVAVAAGDQSRRRTAAGIVPGHRPAEPAPDCDRRRKRELISRIAQIVEDPGAKAVSRGTGSRGREGNEAAADRCGEDDKLPVTTSGSVS